MKNDANHIGNSLQKYTSKHNLEQVRPVVRTQLIYYFFPKLSLKKGPAAYGLKNTVNVYSPGKESSERE
jgi:hypothetical protein